MTPKSGLYYPYIHFRDDQWVKLAALYWPSMARMVPYLYPTADSPTVERFKKDLDFVRDLRPGASAVRTAELFLDLLDSRGAELAKHLGFGYVERDQDGWCWRGPEGRGGRIGFIFAEKLTGDLVSAMSSLGLAMTRPGAAHDSDRPSMRHKGATWIGMDEHLAAVYMSVLADDVAAAHSVAPCTDQPGLVSALGGWSIDTVAGLLLENSLIRRLEDGSEKGRRETIAYMAIDMASPIDIEHVSAEQVVKFRLEHGDELAAFQIAVESITKDLPQFGPEISVDIVNDYVRSAVTNTIDRPRRELEKALRSSKIDTALRSLAVQVTLPGLSALGSAGIGVNPIVGAGVGAAVGFATVVRERSAQKASLRAQAPAANYLIEIDRHLASRSLVRRRIGRSIN